MEPAPALDLVEAPPLPALFARWFASRGWQPRAHQLELLAKAHAGRSVLLIAPTGGGKTLAGFLPSLVELSGTRAFPRQGAPSPLVGEGGEPPEAASRVRGTSSKSRSAPSPGPSLRSGPPSPTRGEGPA